MTQPRAARHRGTVPADASENRDTGIGLIEIVISMFLISLLAIAFIPVIVSALRASELNSTAATATRLVSQAINDARTQGATDCAAAQLLNTTTEEVDAQGVLITVTTTVPTVANCVAGSAITVTVIAINSGDESVLADARTLIYLTGTP
jgi:type II secretory pathway pseudopilin PulG